jgi:AraC-like DNA-binding protein
LNVEVHLSLSAYKRILSRFQNYRKSKVPNLEIQSGVMLSEPLQSKEQQLHYYRKQQSGLEGNLHIFQTRDKEYYVQETVFNLTKETTLTLTLDRFTILISLGEQVKVEFENLQPLSLLKDQAALICAQSVIGTVKFKRHKRYHLFLLNFSPTLFKSSERADFIKRFSEVRLEAGTLLHFPMVKADTDLMEKMTLLQSVTLEENKNLTVYFTVQQLAKSVLHHVSQRVDSPLHPDHEVMQDAVGYIEEHYQEVQPASELADKAGLINRSIREKFHLLTGQTVIDYIIKKRLHRAKFLLLTTDLKVPEISLSSGFGEVTTFHSAFKKEFNFSPYQYKKHHFQNVSF